MFILEEQNGLRALTLWIYSFTSHSKKVIVGCLATVILLLAAVIFFIITRRFGFLQCDDAGEDGADGDDGDDGDGDDDNIRK